MNRAEAVRWLEDARGGGAAWGYVPGASPRPEPTIWACAAGLPVPSDWLADADLGWVAYLAPALLSERPEAAEVSRRALERIGAEGGVLIPKVEHVDGMLQGWSWYPDTFSWLEPTAFAICSLVRAGESEHPRVVEGRALIRDRVCVDGGWNYGNGKVLGVDLLSYVHSTAWALLALPNGDPLAAPALDLLASLRDRRSTTALALPALASAHHGRDPEPWLDLLEARQAPDGSFGERVDRTAMALVALDLRTRRTSPLTGPVSWPDAAAEVP